MLLYIFLAPYPIPRLCLPGIAKSLTTSGFTNITQNGTGLTLTTQSGSGIRHIYNISIG